MARIQVRDIEIHHEIVGEGPQVLLISGTGGDLRNTPPGANPLRKSFRLIAYDQRGLGQTSKPDTPYSMADYADDAAALLAALDVPSAHVVGISFGGMVAQHLAIRHPGVVDRLVLMCTSPGGALASADLLALNDLDGAARASAYLGLLDTRLADGGGIPDDLRPVLDRMGDRVPVTSPEGLMGARRQLEARAGHDTLARLGEITASTLVMGGRTDGIAPPQNLEAIADRIPDAELAFFDGGHLFMLQDRAAWPRAADFLAAGSVAP